MMKMKVIMREVMSQVKMNERNTRKVKRRKRNTRKRRKSVSVAQIIVKKEMLSRLRKLRRKKVIKMGATLSGETAINRLRLPRAR